MIFFNEERVKIFKSVSFYFYYLFYYIIPAVVVFQFLQELDIHEREDGIFLLLYFILTFSFASQHFPYNFPVKSKIFIPIGVNIILMLFFYSENILESFRLQSALTIVGVLLGIFALMLRPKKTKSIKKKEGSSVSDIFTPVSALVFIGLPLYDIVKLIILPYIRLLPPPQDTYFIIYSLISVVPIAFVHGYYFVYGKLFKDN